MTPVARRLEIKNLGPHKRGGFQMGIDGIARQNCTIEVNHGEISVIKSLEMRGSKANKRSKEGPEPIVIIRADDMTLIKIRDQFYRFLL